MSVISFQSAYAEKYEHPDTTTCEAGCPFWRPIHHHFNKGQNVQKCCHHLYYTGEPHPEVCDLAELQREFETMKRAA